MSRRDVELGPLSVEEVHENIAGYRDVLAGRLYLSVFRVDIFYVYSVNHLGRA